MAYYSLHVIIFFSSVYQENEAKRSSKLLSEGRNSSEPSLEKWISKTLTGGDSATKFNIHDETELEVLFKNKSLAPLPPSLILPTPESLLDCNFQDWG